MNKAIIGAVTGAIFGGVAVWAFLNIGIAVETTGRTADGTLECAGIVTRACAERVAAQKCGGPGTYELLQKLVGKEFIFRCRKQEAMQPI